jgi:putative hydrolase of the HAD superfamily
LSRLNGIKAVFFDAVGTLIFPEPSPAKVYVRLAQKWGTEVEELLVRKRILEAFQQQEIIDSQNDWKVDELREWDRWKSIVRYSLPEVKAIDECFQELWDYFRTPLAWRIHPETKEVLTQLTGRGILVGMASNFDGRLAELLKGIEILEPLANRCVISSWIGWRKPSKGFFNEVIRLAKCEAKEILFIGDDYRNDYQGALDSGMQSLLFDPKESSKLENRIQRLSDLL